MSWSAKIWPKTAIFPCHSSFNGFKNPFNINSLIFMISRHIVQRTAWGNVQWNSHFPWAILFPLVRLLSKRWNFCYLKSRIAKANRLLLNRVTRESYSLQSPTWRSSARKWYNFQGLGILLYINSCKYFFS